MRNRCGIWVFYRTSNLDTDIEMWIFDDICWRSTAIYLQNEFSTNLGNFFGGPTLSGSATADVHIGHGPEWTYFVAWWKVMVIKLIRLTVWLWFQGNQILNESWSLFDQWRCFQEYMGLPIFVFVTRLDVLKMSLQMELMCGNALFDSGSFLRITSFPPSFCCADTLCRLLERPIYFIAVKHLDIFRPLSLH